MGFNMNEQIKSIALECYNPYGNFDIEKFALLMVQKCADIGERYADGNYEVYNQILAHFGVEE
jgi:hypothetical protein